MHVNRLLTMPVNSSVNVTRMHCSTRSCFGIVSASSARMPTPGRKVSSQLRPSQSASRTGCSAVRPANGLYVLRLPRQHKLPSCWRLAATGQKQGLPEGWWKAAEPVCDSVDWTALDTRWQGRYWEVVRWLKEHGQYPKRYTAKQKEAIPNFQGSPQEHEGQLHRWCTVQSNYRVRLTRDQHRLLSALPRFPHVLEVDPINPAEFSSMVAAAMAHYERHGRLPIDGTATSTEARQLANWLTDIRGRHVNHGMLTEGQAAAMERIPGFVWASKGKKSSQPLKDGLGRPRFD